MIVRMETLCMSGDPPSEEELKALAARCRTALRKLRETDSEVRLPLIVEFAGSPKSGKTSVISIVAHFFRRMGADVVQPTEGASLRTPIGLRDDWLAFNAWSGCYALQQILSDCYLELPPSLVILDRGLFDVVGWMRFLQAINRLHAADEVVINAFFTLDLWRRRENAVFLFTADYETSMRRELDSKLTSEHGSVMNPKTLRLIADSYIGAAEHAGKTFDTIYHVDTSEDKNNRLSFQRVAAEVAKKIIEVIERMSTQKLLVTEPVGFEGFIIDKSLCDKTVQGILRGGSPLFEEREIAETSSLLQQVVPYAVLENGDGLFFCARRRSKRPELRDRMTILVGGHAEKRDWDAGEASEVFERCIRRELEEELIGLHVLAVEPVGFISDTNTSMSSHHLAYIHRVRVGGRTSLRRQAIDQEFGRGTLEWKSKEEIVGLARQLDPWSQLVAHVMMGAPNVQPPLLFQ